ncbi:MAG: glycosyl hydrolase family 28 protein, partial [Planctomycetota bacterium]
MRTEYFFLLSLVSALLAALPPAHAADAPATKVVTYPAPAGEKASGDYTVQVAGQPVFVYTAAVLHGGPASFAYFDFSGKVSVKVTATRKVDKAVIRPGSAGTVDAIAGGDAGAPTVEGNTITFSLAQPRNLSLELNGSFERPLLLFANPLETDPPKPGDPNVLYFGPGVHEVATTKIESGKTVYLAGGAVVRGKILPGEKPVQERNWAGNKVYENLFCFNNVKNVQVRGRGILDMSALPWHSKCPLSFNNCTGVLVEGIIIKDSPCWCTPVFNCTAVVYRNLKEVCHRENSDGINIVNSQDVVVEGCFLRNNDDEICVKTTAPPPAPEGKNILVKDCVVWNDRAYGIGITYETRCNISNLTFKNCAIIHDHGIFSRFKKRSNISSALHCAKWNRACSNTTRFTRNFAGYERQSCCQPIPRRTLANFTSRYINVHLRDFEQQLQSIPNRRRQQSLPTGNATARPGSPVRQPVGRAVRFCHFAGRLLAARHHYWLRFYKLDFQPC